MNTSVDETFEADGEEAARRVAAGSMLDVFCFKSPGLVNFEIEGLMSGNTLELRLESTFDPYKSHRQKIPPVDVGAQFAVILTGLPSLSKSSKLTALEALKDFALKDIGRAQGLPATPGSVPHAGRYLKTSGSKLLDEGALHRAEPGRGDAGGWYAQVFKVREEGHGEVTRYNEFDKKCLSMSASSAGSSSTSTHPSKVGL